jgi:hypothetical protein
MDRFTSGWASTVLFSRASVSSRSAATRIERSADAVATINIDFGSAWDYICCCSTRDGVNVEGCFAELGGEGRSISRSECREET